MRAYILKACQHFIFTCQRASVEKGVPIFQLIFKKKNFSIVVNIYKFQEYLCNSRKSISQNIKILNYDICLFLLICHKFCISYLSCAPKILLKKHTSCKIITKLLQERQYSSYKTERNKMTTRFLITILDLNFKQISNQGDHNYYLRSHVLFILFSYFICGKFKKSLGCYL